MTFAAKVDGNRRNVMSAAKCFHLRMRPFRRRKRGTSCAFALAPPSTLSGEQRALYDDIMGVVNKSFGSFVAMRQDGVLTGPFNPMLHFPEFGQQPRSRRPSATGVRCLTNLPRESGP